MIRLWPLLLLKSPLGYDDRAVIKGTLHAIRMDAEERLSAPFEVRVDAISDVRGIDPNRLLNQEVTITVRREDAHTGDIYDRFFNGIVCRFDSFDEIKGTRYLYRLTVVPRLWFLDQAIDCRIFQQQTAEQILETLFAEHGVRPVEFRLYGSKAVRPYTTQYNETTLAFAQRIMQESGYYYFFEHSESQHKLIIADGNQAFQLQPRPEHLISPGNISDNIGDWAERLETTYSRVEIQDYDPTKPAKPVEGLGKALKSGDRQVYRWPAMTTDNNVADDRARFRIEAAEARAALRSGKGWDPQMCAGFGFKLEEDVITGASDVTLVAHSVIHTAVDETAWASSEIEWVDGRRHSKLQYKEQHYEISFTCFEKSVRWRDEMTIPRPVMPGIFSGVVLGFEGEEIHTDDLARIKVRPKFDHRKDTTAENSIFIRILHAWAGDKWGWQHLPRVGTEVGIAFMNGDPDNPVCVGCFYHQENMPIFKESEKTKQGFRSRSTVGGDTDEYNELSFEDKKGSEGINIESTVGTIDALAKKSIKINSKIGNIDISADLLTINLQATAMIKLAVEPPIPAAGKVLETLMGVGPPTITMTPLGISIEAPQITMEALESILLSAKTIVLDTAVLIGPPPVPPVGPMKLAVEAIQAKAEVANKAATAAAASSAVIDKV